MSKPKRIILKISGELFQSDNNHINFKQYDTVSKQIIDIQSKTSAEIAIVVGGGNIFRGRQADSKVDSNEADYMGMLATIINGIGLREAMVRNGAVDTRLMTSINVHQMAEPYIRVKAKHHLDNGRIVIISGGLGMPGFSTDSAVTQYACELGCDVIFKASTVDGVYTSDPHKDKTAKKYDKLTYQDTLDKRLGVMDRTAFAMCEKSQIPIFIFDIKDLNKLPSAINDDYSFGTIVQ